MTETKEKQKVWIGKWYHDNGNDIKLVYGDPFDQFDEKVIKKAEDDLGEYVNDVINFLQKQFDEGKSIKEALIAVDKEFEHDGIDFEEKTIKFLNENGIGIVLGLRKTNHGEELLNSVLDIEDDSEWEIEEMNLSDRGSCFLLSFIPLEFDWEEGDIVTGKDVKYVVREFVRGIEQEDPNMLYGFKGHENDDWNYHVTDNIVYLEEIRNNVYGGYGGEIKWYIQFKKVENEQEG